MDHENYTHQPSLELPAPRLEQGEVANDQDAAPKKPEKKKTGGMEAARGDSHAGSPPPLVPILPPAQSSPGFADDTATSATHTVSSHAPAIAEDADLIEKEWVEKAKEIVERTRDDPRQQNKDINRFKADYLKKRYDKDLKTSND